MIKLKPCPFCGGKAGIRWTDDALGMQSVGCVTQSMLCPNPSLVVYKGVDGEFNYTYWNKRENNNE